MRYDKSVLLGCRSSAQYLRAPGTCASRPVSAQLNQWSSVMGLSPVPAAFSVPRSPCQSMPPRPLRVCGDWAQRDFTPAREALPQPGVREWADPHAPARAGPTAQGETRGSLRERAEREASEPPGSWRELRRVRQRATTHLSRRPGPAASRSQPCPGRFATAAAPPASSAAASIKPQPALRRRRALMTQRGGREWRAQPTAGQFRAGKGWDPRCGWLWRQHRRGVESGGQVCSQVCRCGVWPGGKLPSRAAILPGRGVTWVCVLLSVSCERCPSESLRLRPALPRARTWAVWVYLYRCGTSIWWRCVRLQNLLGMRECGDWNGPVV